MIGRYSGYDECKNNRFYKGVGYMKGDKIQLQALDKIGTGTKTAKYTGDPASKNAYVHGNGDHKRIKQHGDDLGEYQIVQRIYPHDLQGIYLFGNAHGANAGGDIRPYFSGHNDGSKGGRKLQDHGRSEERRVGKERRTRWSQ